jgi:hypothetical protein
MTRATPIINSFVAGEVTEELAARGGIGQDGARLGWYYAACRKLENMIVRPQGGARRRGGTRFVAAVKDAASRTALVPFEFSVLQAYKIELGGSYLRFFKDRGRIAIPDVATAIANGTFTGSIASWSNASSGAGSISHDATNNRLNLVSGGTTAADIGAAEQTVTVAAGDQAKEHVLAFRVLGAAGDKGLLNVGTSSGGGQLVNDRECHVGWHLVAFTPGAGTVYVRFKNKGDANNVFVGYNKTLQLADVAFLDNQTLEIASPWAQASLFDSDNLFRIMLAQSADILYFWHPTVAPYKLGRSGHTTWALTLFPFEDGPYYESNTTATTLTPGAATGANVSLTASSTVGINGGAGFKSTDVGRLVAVKEGSTWGWGIIVSHTSATVVGVDIRATFTNINAKATWRLGLYSDTDGWPVTATFFEERFNSAGALGIPNRWDGSASGDFEKFTPGTADGDAVAFTIASNRVDAIRWLAPAQKLIIGTQAACAPIKPQLPAGGIFAASGPSSGAITPTTVEVKEQTGNVVLHIDRHRRDLMEIAFSFEADGYVAEPMTIRAEHVSRGGFIDMAWQRKPFGVLWLIRADGLLIGFTYLRSQQVTAFHRHPIGGNGIVEAIACIPGAQRDELWLIVRRTINGATVRYVEIMEDPLPDDEPDQIKAFYVDSGLTYDGAVAATLTPGAGATVAGTTGVTFTAGSSVFAAGDVGREIRYRVAADPDANPPVTGIEARAVITGYTSGTVVTATVTGAFPSLSAIASGAWRMSVTTISGAGHLEGETVQILADGAVHAEKTVVGGAVTLDKPATYVHLGLKQTSKLMPVRVEAGAAEGTGQGKPTRVARLVARFRRTLGAKAGPDETRLDRIRFREGSDPVGVPPPLFTGDKEFPFPGTSSREADILFVQDQPLPMDLLGIMPVVLKGDG